MKIKLVDLQAQYKQIKKEIDEGIQEVINASAFIGSIKNKYVKEFENNFANWLNVNYCIGTGNGTDSLEIALEALDIGPGDEVLVPALSWISTSEAVTRVGAKPVFVDVTSDTFTLDVSKLQKKISYSTKAIIPVHLYGHPADMNGIKEIALKYKLKIIEDCAQSHGAMYKGAKTGTFGDAAIFSFYPGKNLGAFGDAGCVVTNNHELAEKIRRLTNHGQLLTKHEHKFEGRNSRMDGLQAVVLNIKLKYLDEWNQNRKDIVQLYKEELKDTDLIIPTEKEDCRHVYHLFVIQHPKRDKIKERLDQGQIETAIHYPQILPLLPPYKHKYTYNAEDFNKAYSLVGKVLSLPVHPHLQDEEIKKICKHIKIALE